MRAVPAIFQTESREGSVRQTSIVAQPTAPLRSAFPSGIYPSRECSWNWTYKTGGWADRSILRSLGRTPLSFRFGCRELPRLRNPADAPSLRPDSQPTWYLQSTRPHPRWAERRETALHRVGVDWASPANLRWREKRCSPEPLGRRALALESQADRQYTRRRRPPGLAGGTNPTLPPPPSRAYRRLRPPEPPTSRKHTDDPMHQFFQWTLRAPDTRPRIERQGSRLPPNFPPRVRFHG